MEDIFRPYPDNKGSILTPNGLQFFIAYINVLEGAKTRIKNLHWAAKRLPVNEHKGAHEYLDDFLEVVQDFQDTVAEASQGILGHMTQEVIQGMPMEVNSPAELLRVLTDKTVSFYQEIPSETIYVGIKSETETFIVNLNKYKYLFELTE